MKRSLSACLTLIQAWEKRKRSDSVQWQKPIYQQKCQTGKVTIQKTPWKCSITQRLRTDLGQSIEVATTTKLVWLTGLRAQRGEMKYFRLSVFRGSKYEEWNETVCPSVCLTWTPIMRGEIKWKFSVSLWSKIEGWNETYFISLSILRGSKFEWWNVT